jgi:MinD-like ATPase involved in chromosome partitioning or flagellar assembly
MSQQQDDPGPLRRSTPVATPRSLRRLKVLSSGRWHAPLDTQRLPLIIAVGSAQPGMGKSIVASNLAAAIAGLGRRVVMVDLDFRAPRQHALFGVPADAGLETWLEKKRARSDEPGRATPVRNLRLLPSATTPGVPMPLEQRRTLMRELYDLDSDVVVVDVGADNRDDLFGFFAERAVRLLVATREPAALAATYAFLRSAALRAERVHGNDARAALARFSGGLVGNAIDAAEQEETFHAFSRMVRGYLGIPLPVLGCLRSSERVVQSVFARQPLIVRRGIDDNVRQFHHMAEVVMNDDGAATRDCPLDGDPIDVAVGPLPADIAAYSRKHTRFPVDWTATLELASGVTAVRVRDVSEAGAAVETSTKLTVGDTAVLHLDQLPGRPAIPVIVKNAAPASRRVGLGFAQKGRATTRLAAAARAGATNRST